MAAFQSGFQLGQDAYQRAMYNKARQEELGLRKAKDARDAELHGMTMDEKRRAVARENELAGIRTEMADFMGGINRQATNAALDADFDQAYQATAQGLAMPKMAAPSNAAHEAALTVRAPVDTTSPQFQQGLAALRSRYALASGDMKDFDAVTAAERARIAAQQDSDFALQVVQDPTGEAARGARIFVNNYSRKLSSRVDPKTGMTTFARINGDGDGYDEIKVPPADLGKLAVGYRRLQRGDIGGLDVIAAVNKDLAAVVREELKLDMEIGKANNDATYRSGQLRISQQQADQTGAYYRGLIDARNQAGRQNAAAVEFENQINGVLEGYQAAMAAGPQGREAAAIYAREYDQLRAVAAQRGLKVPPTLQALQAAQKNGPPMKPIKVEDAGQAYLVPQADGSQRLMYSDGRGGYIGENGVLPSDRAAVLAQAGVPQALIPNIVWSDDGTTVLYRGREYALNELEQLARDAARLGANDIYVDELQKLPHGTRPATGLGPRITSTPDPRAPSIYARPEDWAAYRAQQGR